MLASSTAASGSRGLLVPAGMAGAGCIFGSGKQRCA